MKCIVWTEGIFSQNFTTFHYDKYRSSSYRSPQFITDQLQIKENISIFDCILQTRIEPIHMNQNQLLHNVSHETIDIPDYLSTIFDWFQVWAFYENLAKTNTHAITPVLAVVLILQEKEQVSFREVDMYMKKLVEVAM